MGDRRKQPSFI
jgi:hypothetical protein